MIVDFHKLIGDVHVLGIHQFAQLSEIIVELVVVITVLRISE